MKAFLYGVAHLLGFEKDADSPSNSEDDDDWGDENPRKTIIREQLEYYFSGNNLEKDATFREEIAKNEKGAVPVEYILQCNRMKILQATEEEILETAHWSQYLEADEGEKIVRSKTPFISDPQRNQRTLKITGIGKAVPQFQQIEFYESIFPGEIEAVHLFRKEIEGILVYTNTSFVEFSTVERAKEVLENGIEYGNEELIIKPVYAPNDKQQNNQKQYNGKARQGPKGKRARVAKPKPQE